MQYPFLLRNAVSPQCIHYVKLKVEAHWDKFIFNGPGRQFYQFADDSVILLFKHELAESFGIRNWILDPFFNDFIGYHTEGGMVHPHTDPSVTERAHTRINVLISKPDTGGMPLLDDQKVDVNVGDAWLNFADISRHSSTPVKGNTPRIVLSLGMQVAKSEIYPYQEEYKEWLAS